MASRRRATSWTSAPSPASWRWSRIARRCTTPATGSTPRRSAWWSPIPRGEASGSCACFIRVRSGAEDLHGSAPDSSPVVLLVIDAINDFQFVEGRQVLAEAHPMGVRIRRLKSMARQAGISTIYVNDNFGRWRSDFRTLIAHCLRQRARGRAVARLLRPDRRDYFVLKPKHSAFYSTTLELLLEHLRAQTLILTGLLADSCILFTAQDAFVRGYD